MKNDADKATAIDFDDLQGLIRFGHGQLTEARFLILTVIDAASAGDWLRHAPLTSAATANPRPQMALQIAFTAPGLRALDVSDDIIADFSEEFIAGTTSSTSDNNNRCRRLGDVGANSPEHWVWGGSNNDTPHLVLMLYAQAGCLDTWQADVQGDQFKQAFALQHVLDTTPDETHEPFGFADGISQPEIDWQRKLNKATDGQADYSNRLALGEILLGYPNEYGLYTERPLLNPELTSHAHDLPDAEDQPGMKDLGRNGSYLVLRQLDQDVPGFWQFIDQQSGGDALQREQLAAAMVGRQRDGTPLLDPSRQAITGIDKNKSGPKFNHFNFDADPKGRQCPIGAHIRRSNPRTGDFPATVSGLISRVIHILGFGRQQPKNDLIASSRFHRILRRGRTYGVMLAPEDAINIDMNKTDAPVAERGLQFICLGANISRQFEFVQNAWIMSSKFAGLSSESDPLLGNREALINGSETNRFTLPQTAAPARCIKDLPQFITVRGSAYFFMPGLKALQYIATMSARSNDD